MESEKNGNYHTQLLLHGIYNQTQVNRTRERFFVTPILVRTFLGWDWQTVGRFSLTWLSFKRNKYRHNQLHVIAKVKHFARSSKRVGKVMTFTEHHTSCVCCFSSFLTSFLTRWKLFTIYYYTRNTRKQPFHPMFLTKNFLFTRKRRTFKLRKHRFERVRKPTRNHQPVEEIS